MTGDLVGHLGLSFCKAACSRQRVLSKIFWTKNMHQRNYAFDDINYRKSWSFYRRTLQCTPTQPLVHTVCTALEIIQCHVGPLRRTTNTIFVISEKAFLGSWLATWSHNRLVVLDLQLNSLLIERLDPQFHGYLIGRCHLRILLLFSYCLNRNMWYKLSFA
jgi:hypothetical protein